MWELIGIALFIAVLHEPTRRRIDDCISVLLSGKTSAEKKAEQAKIEMELIAAELRDAAQQVNANLSQEVSERVAVALIERHKEPRSGQ